MNTTLRVLPVLAVCLLSGCVTETSQTTKSTAAAAPAPSNQCVEVIGYVKRGGKDVALKPVGIRADGDISVKEIPAPVNPCPMEETKAKYIRG